MHTMDLGVATDCLGNVFLEILRLLPGTRAEKVSNLWHRMKQWYVVHRPHSQLQTVTWEMIKKVATSPATLRAKAAERRALIPVGAALAKEFDNGDPHRCTFAHLMNRLEEISVLVTSVPYQAEKTAQTCKRFALLYTAPWRGKQWSKGIRFPGGPSQRCTFCRSSWSTLIWKLAPHLDPGRIWTSHGEVGWPQQGPREEGPTTLFPSLTELEPEISGFHC